MNVLNLKPGTLVVVNSRTENTHYAIIIETESYHLSRAAARYYRIYWVNDQYESILHESTITSIL